MRIISPLIILSSSLGILHRGGRHGEALSSGPGATPVWRAYPFAARRMACVLPGFRGAYAPLKIFAVR